jgi:imidazolonepropionase
MPPQKRATLLIKNIGQLVTMAGPAPRIGSQMKHLEIIKDGGIASAADEIIAVGKSIEIEGQSTLAESCTVIDAKGAVVTPGLIDPHTHPVFSKTREEEFEMRTLGKTYEEIAAAGGGIRSSVRDLRQTSRDIIEKKTKARLDRLLKHGVTTVEAKSGYGLSTESEIMQLEIIKRLNEMHPIDLVPTFLGAHEIPDEYRNNRDNYINLLINEMLPIVAKRKLADFCDVFCEENVYTVEESRRIQEGAKNIGLKLKFHADELKSTGGAELAASMGATSADHLVYISDTGIKALTASRTVAVLLPGTSFSLRSKLYAPARKLIESGAIVALATDCNPGSSYSENLPFMTTLASLHYRMTAAEAITAVTVNAACAIGKQDKIGRLEPGLQADMVIWDMEDYREMPYHYAVNLVSQVIKKGKVIPLN